VKLGSAEFREFLSWKTSNFSEVQQVNEAQSSLDGDARAP